ncbi:bone morphogenetic protein 7 [Biomphalaria glabrata]|nr:bone morphogenetic protein 7 [Biomphalaria glabrata]
MKFLFILMFISFTTLKAMPPSYFIDNQLGQSVPLTNVQHREREELRKELLLLMGLPKKPKVKAQIKHIQSASTFMYDLYETMSETNDPGFRNQPSAPKVKAERSDMIVSYVNMPHKVRYPRNERDRVFYFDFQVSDGERVKSAELRLYKEAVRGEASNEFTLNLYDIKVVSEDASKGLELEATLKTYPSKRGWISLDVTQVVQIWELFPLSNNGLYLKVTNATGHGIEPRHTGIIGNKGPPEKQAFLVTYMESSSKLLRKRRSLRNRLRKEPQFSIKEVPYSVPSIQNVWNEGVCRWHNFYISFRDIGFDDKFLIAPEGYYASFCAGKCQFPMDVNSNATNHAVMQMLVHTIRPEAAPVPCCAPKDYGSISLLYYDDKSSVVLRRFKDMVVRTCGCQ